MTTNTKEIISFILAGAAIMVVAYMLLLKKNDIKSDILTSNANEKTLISEKRPLDMIIEKYKIDGTKKITDLEKEYLDSVVQKNINISIDIIKSIKLAKLFESTLVWIDIILAFLFVSGASLLSMGLTRFIR